MVKKIRAKGIDIISEIELAFRFKGDSKIIAITGSNGKTTTTALTHHICKQAGLDCGLVGNIGYSFARQVAEDPKPLYVAEVSSFQLDDIKTFRPDIAVLTNITEDHLDRYDYQFENYIRSKFRIAENQQENGYFIYCADDEVTMKYLNDPVTIGFSIRSNQLPISMKRELPNGAFIKDGDMYIRTGQDFVSMSVYDFALKGKHNQYNTMAAGVAAATMEITKKRDREAVMNFQALQHRMEPVAKSGALNLSTLARHRMKLNLVCIGNYDKAHNIDLEGG
jgi:UDP-N-acetylmuramoylalanine--D-glutamate ligase